MGLEKGCPCCKLYKDGLEFKKVIELERAGLVIYRHTTPVNSVASVSQEEKAFNTKNDVFIIHNTRNMNVSTTNYMSEFELAINCPRCKFIVKHTKELLLNVPFIKKKDVIGICDHCRFMKRLNERCNKCQVVVEEFLKKQEQRQTETRDSIKQDTEMLSQIKNILKDAPKALFVKSKTQTHSEKSLKRQSLSYKRSPTCHVPRVKDMFDIQKKTEKKHKLQKKGFLGHIEPKKLYINKSDSEITFIEAKKRQEPRKKILFNSAEDIARPESLDESGESADSFGLDKKQHRLRQKLKPKIEVDPTFKKVPSQELEEYLIKDKYISSPVEYETKKWPSEESDIHEKEKYKYKKKYQHSYDDLHNLKYDQEVSKPLQKKDDIYVRGLQKKSMSDHNIQQYSKYQPSYDDQHSKHDQEVSKPSQKKDDSFVRGIQKKSTSDHNIRRYSKYQLSDDDQHDSKYDQEVPKPSQKKEDVFVRGIQKQSRSDHNIRRHLSEKSLLRPTSEKTEHELKKDFSYFFIKEEDDVKKKPRKRVSSSELIKDTQDMYRARAEEERIKKEQELKEKLEAEEKKRLAKIERQKWLEEQRRLEELKKKKAEEDKIKSKKHEEEQDLHTIKPSKQDTEAQDKSVKTSKETSGKSKSIKLNAEIKESKIEKTLKSERDSLKSKKDLDKSIKSERDSLKSKKDLEKPLKSGRDSLKPKKDQDKSLKSERDSLKAKKDQDKSLKSERDSIKAKKDQDKSLKSERDSLKAKKDQDKQEKEESLRLEKERKLKEKADKEEQMRKANEVKQREKEQKDKEKANKEEQMRLAKEEKQREKEEKEKEKANKEEQMRKAKEEKQREKEEKEKQEAQLRNDKEQKQREKEQKLKDKEERQREKDDKIRQQKEENEKNAKEKEEKLKNQQMEQQLLADAQKDKESKFKKKQDDEAKKKEAQQKLKSLKEAKEEEPEKPQSKKLAEESKMKDLNINQVKVRRSSPDDLILRLVRLKQKQAALKDRPTRMSQLNISNKTLHDHKGHRNAKSHRCMICLDSDLELDIENIRLNETKPKEKKEIIIGQQIFKNKPSLVTKKEDKEISPLLFSSRHDDENIIKPQEVTAKTENIPQEKEKKPPTLSGKNVEQEVPKGIIRYALSDRTFIEKGWTMLPTEKVVRKMNVYRMRPAHPEFDWFEHNKNRKLICYDTGEKLAEFDDNGKGRWFYRSGKVALDYYDAEEINAQQRIVIFSSGEPDDRGCSRPFAILATFDYLGNGIVFDHAGKIRLKYNQTEGVVLDRAIGPVSHWKWHTLNDPPVLQQVMIDTQMAHKDPEILKLGGPHDNKPRPDNEEMLAIEFDNFIKEKSKKLSQKFKPFQIKMKALKINEHFSLKVLDQATVYLIFRDGSTNLKLNIGMILDHQEIVDTDTAEVGEVSNSLECFPARTDSLAGLQRSVAHAQAAERARAERSQRLRPERPVASADRLLASLARPRPAPPPPPAACPCRKPSARNLYYDTRLI